MGLQGTYECDYDLVCGDLGVVIYDKVPKSGKALVHPEIQSRLRDPKASYRSIGCGSEGCSVVFKDAYFKDHREAAGMEVAFEFVKYAPKELKSEYDALNFAWGKERTSMYVTFRVSNWDKKDYPAKMFQYMKKAQDFGGVEGATCTQVGEEALTEDTEFSCEVKPRVRHVI